MATSSSSSSSTTTKAPCVTDGCKSLGILKCEGCSQIFCRKHVNEHRDILSHELEKIVLEHDTLQQTIAKEYDEENQQQSLFEQINQWERQSIEKIRQTAEEVRQQVKLFTSSQKEISSKQLQNLAEQLRQARIDDDYVEIDLCRWTTVLEKLKHEINAHSLITICEDPTKTIVTGISSSIIKQQAKFNETFGEIHGHVLVEKNGYVARHCGEKRGHAFVRGIGEYLSGKHKIRFIVNKQTTSWDILFGIVSKRMRVLNWTDESDYSVFGWWSNDEAYPSNNESTASKSIRDFKKGQRTLEIELVLDCDKQIISYFNERTKTMRQLNIDIKKCPFPWQLVFNMYNSGDQVRLIRSCSTD